MCSSSVDVSSYLNLCEVECDFYFCINQVTIYTINDIGIEQR